MRESMFCLGSERVSVVRVGREFAVVRSDGSVHGHRTYADATSATRVAIRLSRGVIDEVVETCGEEVVL